jgi:undecaprenyl-diphosphatase
MSFFELLKAVILGVVQGATEFLPVSSSGHLVLGGHLLGFAQQGILFDVMVHVGTLCSVVLVFRRDLVAMIAAPAAWLRGRRDMDTTNYLQLDGLIVIATIPAVLVGLGFKSGIETLFTSVCITSCMLVVTGVMMIASGFVPDRDRPINGWRAWLIGCAQAAAIVPGISRSGATIFTGMLLGVNRERAARFSFILSIPAIVGAALLNGRSLFYQPLPAASIWYLLAGFCGAAITGYGAIVWLLAIIRRNRLPWFGVYCFIVACIGLLVCAMEPRVSS